MIGTLPGELGGKNEKVAGGFEQTEFTLFLDSLVKPMGLSCASAAQPLAEDPPAANLRDAQVANHHVREALKNFAVHPPQMQLTPQMKHLTIGQNSPAVVGDQRAKTTQVSLDMWLSGSTFASPPPPKRKRSKKGITWLEILPMNL